MRIIDGDQIKERIFNIPVPDDVSRHNVLHALYKVTDIIDGAQQLFATPRGDWEDRLDDSNILYCTSCGRPTGAKENNKIITNYCSNCGTRNMRVKIKKAGDVL